MLRHSLIAAAFAFATVASSGAPSSAATPGSGNSFYSGPASAGTSGTASLPGCHTLYVRAWDNIGESAVNSYGPVEPAIVGTEFELRVVETAALSVGK